MSVSSKSAYRTRSGLALGLALCLALGFAVTVAQAKGPSVLPGGNSKEPISIEANKLDYLDKEQKAIYSGNVVAKQGDSTVRSSLMTIFLDKSGSADPAAAPAAPTDNGQIKRIELGGPVTISSKDQIGTGDEGVYEKASNTFVLTGHVVLTQGKNVQSGDKLTYNLTSGQAIITGGRVKGIFVPGQANPQAPKN